MAPSTRFCLSIEIKQASTASVQPSNDIASSRPIEKRACTRIIFMMTSLWPMMAIRIRIHAIGSSRGCFTLRNMAHALKV
jgi:hypothetical protein